MHVEEVACTVTVQCQGRHGELREEGPFLAEAHVYELH